MTERWTIEEFAARYLEWTPRNQEEVGVEFTHEGLKLYSDDGKPYVLTLEPIPPTLQELGLEREDSVRFRDRPGANWKTGTVRGTNKDGSVVIHQDSNGFSRSIHVEFIEKKGTGKRGADKWISVSP